jgi:hypothetical protein
MLLDTCELSIGALTDGPTGAEVSSSADLATWPAGGDFGKIMTVSKQLPSWLLPVVAIGGGSIIIYGAIRLTEKKIK